VNQSVLSPLAFRFDVGQENGSTTHSEQAVWKKHGSLIALVVVGGDDLRAHNHSVRVGVDLEKVTRQVDGNKAGTAPHSREVEALDVASEFVLVDHHGGQRWGWRKEAAVHYENVDVLRLQTRFLEQRVHG